MLTPCRVTITHMFDQDDGGSYDWWEALCVCGHLESARDMPVEAFEDAYSHYVEQHGARGKLFIDLADAARKDDT